MRVDTIVTDNDTTGSTGTNAINSNVIYQRTRRVANLSNLPTTGSWNSGDKIYRTRADCKRNYGLGVCY